MIPEKQIYIFQYTLMIKISFDKNSQSLPNFSGKGLEIRMPGLKIIRKTGIFRVETGIYVDFPENIWAHFELDGDLAEALVYSGGEIRSGEEIILHFLNPGSSLSLDGYRLGYVIFGEIFRCEYTICIKK